MHVFLFFFFALLRESFKQKPAEKFISRMSPFTNPPFQNIHQLGKRLLGNQVYEHNSGISKWANFIRLTHKKSWSI